MHRLMSAPLDFHNNEINPSMKEKKLNMPCLSDHVYPVLLDIDPTQGIEDEYKNKHNLIFCWRMLKQISYIDLKNFATTKQFPHLQNDSVKQEGSSGGKFIPFEGNIEEQALIIHEKSSLKDVPTKVEYSDEDDDVEMQA